MVVMLAELPDGEGREQAAQNPEGIPAQSPGLRAREQPWVNDAKPLQPQRGCGSIPHVPLIPLEFMSTEQSSQLVLKAHFPMMLLLPGNVDLDPFEVRLTH